MVLLKSGSSVATWLSKPTTAYGSQANLVLASGAGNDFLQIGLPTDLKKGATVLSAKLRVYQTAPWSAVSRTLSVQRVSAKWLLSTITWSNQPGVTGTAVTATSSAAGVAGTMWEFDVATDVQTWVNGAANYGWRLTTNDATARYVHGFAAATFKPVLDVTYAYPPATPTNLHPSAGAVSIAKPVVSYDSGDVVSHQVQVDAAANGVAPAFDSGELATTTEELNLATTAYAGLAAAATTQWRVRVRNSAGILSAWSQWATFNRINKATLTVSQPPATIYEPSPPVNFAMTGMVAWQVYIQDLAEPGVSIYDSLKVAGTVGEHTPDYAVCTEEGHTYRFTVRAWDAIDREATTGDPLYAQTSVNALLGYDLVQPGADTLTAVQAKPAPWIDLTFTRAAAPDGWAIMRDNVVIYTAADADDLHTTGITYAWRDWTVSPNRTHVYRACPIVNGKVTKTGPTVTLVSTGVGLWLANAATGTTVVLFGDETGTWAHGEDAATYYPIGASAPVRITAGMRGLEGSLSGVLVNVPGLPVHTVDAMESALWVLKGTPSTVLRLVAGDINIPVNIYELSMWPDPTSRADERVVNVAFGFNQVGELPYKAVL